MNIFLLDVKINNRFFFFKAEVSQIFGLHLENFLGEWRVGLGVTTHISVTVSVQVCTDNHFMQVFRSFFTTTYCISTFQHENL